MPPFIFCALRRRIRSRRSSSWRSTRRRRRPPPPAFVSTRARSTRQQLRSFIPTVRRSLSQFYSRVIQPPVQGVSGVRNYGSCTDACGRSWSCRVSHPKGCSIGALGPGEAEDRLSSRRRGSNLMKIDVWTLPGPSGPTLSPRHFWTPFGSLLEDRFGTHFCSISEAVSGLILELIWSVESIPESSKKA